MSARHHDPRASDLARENERLRRELTERDEQIRRQAEQIAEQQKQIADAERQIADAEKQIADAEKQIADAEKQIAELERQLALRKQNSTNSSKPPSSDGLAGEPRERGRRKKSRRLRAPVCARTDRHPQISSRAGPSRRGAFFFSPYR